MKYLSSILAFASLASLAVAAPSKTLERRADQCGATTTVTTGAYTLNNDVWDEAAANPGGAQCFGVDSLVGNTLAWHTSWTWQGNPEQVKSYANAEVNFTPKTLSQVSSIPSSWSYSMSPGNFNADISYDIFTDSNPANTGGGDHHDYEIMIWLADLGTAGPISASYGANGKPNYAATGVELAGVSWNLAKGTSGAAGGGEVYSFVASSQVTDFNGDLMDFFKYLQQSQGLPFTQYLVYVAAGTEAFTGSNALLKTTAFSASVN